jgi:hypothetical protein
MVRRGVRLAFVALGLVLTGVATWQAVAIERTAAARYAQTTAHVRTAGNLRLAVGELRATLYAYAAPGQGDAFWAGRAASLFDAIADTLDALASAPGASADQISAAKATLERLTTAESKAREYEDSGEPRLASEVVFTDAKSLVDTLASQASTLAAAIDQASGTTDDHRRRSQAWLATFAVGGWALIATVLGLVPVGGRDPSLALDARPTTSGSLSGFDEPLAMPPGSLINTPASEPSPAPVRDRLADSLAPDWALLAEVCRGLACVQEAADIEALLARGADAVGATGLVVWLPADDGRGLAPAQSCGYERARLARAGTLPLDAVNITAHAFRDGRAHRQEPDDGALAAFAVPLVGAGGAAGVLSGELAAGHDLAAATSAAAILAAQLSLLAAPQPAGDADERPPQQAHA